MEETSRYSLRAIMHQPTEPLYLNLQALDLVFEL